MRKPILYCLFLCYAFTASSNTMTTIIDHYLADIYQKSAAPGFSVVVVKDKDILFLKGYGVEVKGRPGPMTAQSSVAIGSLTKSFTSLAVLQLVEQGKVELDEKVVKYIPEFTTANQERSNQITVRMLLNNTSGLYGGIGRQSDLSQEAYSRLLQVLKSVYLKRPPGSSYEYSNTGFAIAGLLISRVSGMPYQQYIEQNILSPLQMQQSAADPELFSELNVLNGHYFGQKSGIPAPMPVYSSEMLAAGAAMRSSAADLGHYLIALLNDGQFQDQQIIMPSSITQLWKPNIYFQGLSAEDGGDGKAYAYGLGWMISDIDGRTIIHHGGSAGTMSSFTMIDPQTKTAATILMNLDYNFIDKYRFQPMESILNNLLHLVNNEPLSDYGIKRKKDESVNSFKLDTPQRKNYTGDYRMESGGDYWLMYGVGLKIQERKDGVLEGIISRGKTTIMRFNIDFLNPSLAVNRNLMSPEIINFQLQPSKKALSAVFFGTKFIKLQDQFFCDYQPITFQEHTFYLPKSWKLEKTYPDHQLWQSSNEMTLKVVKRGSENTLQKMQRKHFPKYDISTLGKVNTETKGRFIWQQQSAIAEKDGQSYQVIVWSETSGQGQLSIIASAPVGKIDWEELEVMLSYLE